MKNKLNPIFISILFIVFSTSVQISAQNITDNSSIKTKKIEKEVSEFGEAFIKEFEQVKDISLVDRNKFVDDFYYPLKRFDEHWSDGNLKLLKTLSETDRNDFLINQFNNFFLQLMTGWSVFDYDKHYSIADDDDVIEDLRKILPPNIFKVYEAYYKKLKQENVFLDNTNLKNAAQVKSYTTFLKDSNSAHRQFLNNRTLAEKKRFKEAMELIRDDTLASNNPCSDDCYGFPPNTIIYNYLMYPYDIDMVRIKGSLKIISIVFHDGD